MKKRERIDISGYSYDEFVSFVFDREIRAQEGEYHPWYFDVEVAFDANVFANSTFNCFAVQISFSESIRRLSSRRAFGRFMGPHSTVQRSI